MNTDREIERLTRLTRGLLYRNSQLARRLDQHDHAILELAAALREAGTDGRGVLPSPPAPEPASQNAAEFTMPRTWADYDHPVTSEP